MAVPRRTLLLAAAALTVTGVAAVVAFALRSGAGQSERPSANPEGPYVVSAIDYHFHDAHPTFPLAPNRTVTWTNDGTVPHNVTFPEFGYTKDIPVGHTISIRKLGEKLGGPGVYTFFCAYHENLGMVGTVIIG
jgi:plastocyanin